MIAMQETNLSKPTTAFRRIVVRSNGRLHFGLSEICPKQPNCFAGIGLMIDHSIAEMEATVSHVATPEHSPSETLIQADEYWKPRIQTFLNCYKLNRITLLDSAGFLQSIVLRASPSPHYGLGSGTQMACTLATLLQAIDGLHDNKQQASQSEMSIEEILRSYEHNLAAGPKRPLRHLLAEISQRGKRSNIGLQGFIEGGFIVDHGQEYGESGDDRQQELSTPPLRRTDHYAFPSNWPILLVQDNTSALGDSGAAELEMFDRCSYVPNTHRNAMLSLVSNEIVPALQSNDWETFDRSLGQYGQMAGSVFKIAQGGIYRTPQIAATVSTIQKLGIKGAVQSSWGPTVSCVARDVSHAAWCYDQLCTKLPDATVTITYAVNHSARVFCE